jgi:hypothetical protein
MDVRDDISENDSYDSGEIEEMSNSRNDRHQAQKDYEEDYIKEDDYEDDYIEEIVPQQRSSASPVPDNDTDDEPYKPKIMSFEGKFAL